MRDISLQDREGEAHAITNNFKIETLIPNVHLHVAAMLNLTK